MRSNSTPSSDLYFEVKLDQTVWTQAAEPQASVWFSRDSNFVQCVGNGKVRKLNKVISELSVGNVLFGRGCGNIVVLMPEAAQKDIPPDDRLAVARHEAFHAMAQLAIEHKIRLDLVASSELIDKRQEDIAVASFFENLAGSLDRGGHNETCNLLSEGFKNLSDSEQISINWQSYIEWPAEFYMAESLFANNERGYLLLRHKSLEKGRINWRYIAGYRAMNLIDGRVGRRNWQRMYNNGVAPLDLLGQALGCNEPILSFSPIVDMRPSKLPDFFRENF